MDPLHARSAPPNTGRQRSLTVVAAVALVGAAVLAIAGLGAEGGDDAILYADDVVASIVPSTVPPAVTSGPPATAPSATAPSATAPQAVPITEPARAPSTDPPTTTVPEEVAPRAEPTRLQIDTIDVSRFPIRDVGLQENGQLEIPDETEIGWYKYGATAGHPGATVLAAHVNWGGSRGPFAQLGAVEPGDKIEVALDDGSSRSYVVAERATYGKLSLPRDRIWRNTGPEELVLITCGGDFNPEIRSFKSNIVVFAVPIG